MMQRSSSWWFSLLGMAALVALLVVLHPPFAPDFSLCGAETRVPCLLRAAQLQGQARLVSRPVPLLPGREERFWSIPLASPGFGAGPWLVAWRDTTLPPPEKDRWEVVPSGRVEWPGFPEGDGFEGYERDAGLWWWGLCLASLPLLALGLRGLLRRDRD
jgi:hypothetical protein